MKKAGIIRCQQTEDMCPGTTDFKVAAEGTGAFAETGPVHIVGFVSCGGCPGKKAVPRAAMMVERGAEIIVFASCMTKGNPIGFPFVIFRQSERALKKGLGIRLLVSNGHTEI
jgi:predicted metal-binding protein